MAEYYAVLSKAVGSLEANGPDTRREVYDKARNALIGQLKAIDPPLPTSEISRQRLELEEAIRRVEREAANAPPPPPPPSPPRARPAATTGAVPARQSPQDVFRRAIEEADRTSPQQEEHEPVSARADATWEEEDVHELRAERVPPARPAQSYLPSQGYVEDEPVGEEPRLVPNYDYEWDPAASPHTADRNDLRAEPRAARTRPRRSGRGGREAVERAPREARSSRLPAIILTVLIVAMAGGLAALAYSQRTFISDFIASFDSGGSSSETPVADVSAPATLAPDAPVAGKDNDRLVGGGDAGVRDVTSEPAPGASADATPARSATADAAPASGDALVAQRAVLYEEPQAGSAADSGVLAFNATVVWNFLQKPGEEPEIDGNLTVPDRGLDVKLHIRRNTDATLPASHVVEVVVETKPNFPGQSIRDIPRIVLKPSEDARGQPLIGASAKVADGFFWIALSGVDADVKTNLQLLKDNAWIDLPLVYENGQRAILTFEKGTPGERVFASAMEVWGG